MIKRTKIGDYKVTRYSKPLTAIKLKDDDKVVSISDSNSSNVLIATSNGYALWYGIDEVPIIGTKGSGVKAINLKDNCVINGSVFNDDLEYIAIITDKGTGKRIRISDIERTSRARKGVLIIREVKTNPHKIVKTFVTDNKRLFGIKSLNDIVSVKASELTIMDRYSTGTNIYKGTVKDAFEMPVLNETESHNDEIVDQPTNDVDEQHNEYKQLSLLDIDDNLDKIDDILDNLDDDL
jgi:topoisomerase-4 subunit A